MSISSKKQNQVIMRLTIASAGGSKQSTGTAATRWNEEILQHDPPNAKVADVYVVWKVLQDGC